MVTLNEPALKALLETDNGPVGRDVRQYAEEVRNQAREFIRDIMAGVSVDPEGAVDYVMQGDGSAIVGIKYEGSMTEYLDHKAADENEAGSSGDWMRNALRVVFPG